MVKRIGSPTVDKEKLVEEILDGLDLPETADAEVVELEPMCRFLAGFDTERSARADARPGWEPYLCPVHGRWHLTKAGLE